jgi:spore germination cell wall hydrolase CwlJ-like protein
MTEDDLLALNVYKEAAGEIEEGRAAIARVVLNRAKRHYASDGTIPGVIFHPNAFSWLWFAFTGSPPAYHRVNSTRAQAEATAARELAAVHPAAFADCRQIAMAVKAGTYAAPLYAGLTDDVVLYYNPDPRITPHTPAWAPPEAFVCAIGHHRFFKD